MDLRSAMLNGKQRFSTEQDTAHFLGSLRNIDKPSFEPSFLDPWVLNAPYLKCIELDISHSSPIAKKMSSVPFGPLHVAPVKVQPHRPRQTQRMRFSVED
jgi:hypothetical protein